MATRPLMVPGEWYHCFSRGVEKREVFETSVDYDRFLSHLYVSNGMESVRISSLPDIKLTSILEDDSLSRGEPLVDIGAYALMPNHFHLLVREVRERGIATFMQKVCTGYTMYFNNKRQRTGALFSGTYKSKHISDDRYLKQVVPYVLLNPVGLFEPRWKEGVGAISDIEQKILGYPYSSIKEFYGIDRPEKKVVSGSLANYYDTKPTLPEMLESARDYYLEHFPQV